MVTLITHATSLRTCALLTEAIAESSFNDGFYTNGKLASELTDDALRLHRDIYATT